MNQQTRCPNIGEYVGGAGTLVEIQNTQPPPPPPESDFIFEEVTARVEMWRDKCRISTFSTYWDAYGPDSAVNYAITEAQSVASNQGITADSEVELRVIKIVSRTRKRVMPNFTNYYSRHFPKFEAKSIGSKWEMPDDVETIVWSTKTDLTTPKQ